MNATTYELLREKLERAKANESRAQGALSQARKTLKAKFDCASLTEADDLIRKRKEKVRKLTTQLERGVTEFERKWNQTLNG